MRHVPDDELHAYLDQALSRSQCAEIETHLAACAPCRDLRDAIASLRDRTTALLGRLTPRPLIVPQPFETLMEKPRAVPLAVVAPRTLRRIGLWAASIAAALGLGWAGRSALGNPASPMPPSLASVTPEAVSAAKDVAGIDLESVARPVPVPEHPIQYGNVRPASYSGPHIVPAPVIQLVSAVLSTREPPASTLPDPTPDTHSPFDRIWRSVTWEEALRIAGSGLPFIEGMTVLGVLMQPGSGGERPTVIVTQQDQTGEMIQSIEGPAVRVTELLLQQTAPDLHASEITRTPPDYVEGPGGFRRSLRALSVIGRLPTDSLNALARMATIR